MRGLYNLPFLRNFLGPRIKPTDSKLVRLTLGEEICQDFSNAYFNLLAALVDQDSEFVQKVCHRDLAARINQELKIIEQNRLAIKLCSPGELNADDGKYLQISPNEAGKYYWQSSDTSMDVAALSVVGLSMATRDQHKDLKSFKRGRRIYYMDLSQPTTIIGRLIRQQIIVLTVDIVSRNKLYIENEKGDLVQGSKNPQQNLRSIVRFESDSQYLDFKITDINHEVHEIMSLQPKQPSTK